METKPWWEDESRAPKVADSDEVLFSEHGRILDGIDYRSHWFRLVRERNGGMVCLLVEHGAGYECLPEWSLRKAVAGLTALDSDARYLMLYALYQMYREGANKAYQKTSEMYRTAFAQGRLKKRKMRGRDAYRITLEPTHIRTEVA